MEPEKYPLDYEKLVHFLASSYDKKNIPEITTRFAQDIASVIQMLYDVKERVTTCNLKNRITRIIRKLERAETDSTTGDESSSEGGK